MNLLRAASHWRIRFIFPYCLARSAHSAMNWKSKEKQKTQQLQHTKKRKRNAHHSIRHINRRENRKNNQIEAKTNTHMKIHCASVFVSLLSLMPAYAHAQQKCMYFTGSFSASLVRSASMDLSFHCTDSSYTIAISCRFVVATVLFYIMNASHQLRNATTQRNIMHRMELLVYKRLYAKDETSQRIHHMS